MEHSIDIAVGRIVEECIDTGEVDTVAALLADTDRLQD